MERKNYAILLFLFIIVIFNTFLFSLPPNYTDPTGYPSPWPDNNDWAAYTYFEDNILDKNGNNDNSTGGTTPNQYVDVVSDSGFPSVYYYGNGSVLFMRLVLNRSPLSDSGKGQPFKSATWNLLLDIDGDGFKEFVVQLDGTDKGEQPDDLKVYYDNNNSQSFSTSELLWKQDSAKNINNPSNSDGESGDTDDWDKNPDSKVWDFSRTRLTEFDYNFKTYYLLDIQIPIEVLDASASSGPVVNDKSRLSLGFTTSNSNTDPTQKDFVYSGDFIMSPSNPIPFGDNVNFNGGSSQDPWFAENGITVDGCGPNSLISANVVDTNEISSFGDVVTSIDSVEFYYYYDKNENGIADDGLNWVKIGDASLIGTINPWQLSWDTTVLPQGSYLIKGFATDKQSNTQDSYNQYVNGDARVIAIMDNDSCGITPFNISGKVFEDSGADGNPFNSGNDFLKEDVYVRLYSEADGISGLTSGDGFIDETTTDSNGEYSFEDLISGNYYIVVNSKSVNPESLNSGYVDADTWAEQTFVREYVSGSYSEYQKFGGENPAISDDFDISSTVIDDNTYEHISNVQSTGSVNNIDFGFSFEVIVNENDTGNDLRQKDGNQGSFRQFILNANALSGENTSRFVMMTPQNTTIGLDSWWTITLQDLLQDISDDDTNVIGTVYDTNGNIINSNSSTFGGGKVGLDEITILPFQGTEIEININNEYHGIQFRDSSSSVLKNISLYNSGWNNNNNSRFGSVKIVEDSNNFQLIDVIVGSRANGDKPSLSDLNERFGVYLDSDDAIINHSYLSHSGHGLFVYSNSKDVTITLSQITHNAENSPGGDDGNGVTFFRLGNNSGVLVEKSLFLDNGGEIFAYERGNGLMFRGTHDGVVSNITSVDSAAANVGYAGSDRHLLTKSVLNGAFNGPGVRIGKKAQYVYVTENSFGNNDGLSIDLVTRVKPVPLLRDSINPNDNLLNLNNTTYKDFGNWGIDHPVITSYSQNGNTLTIQGYIGKNSGTSRFGGATVEFYTASAGSGDSSYNDGKGDERPNPNEDPNLVITQHPPAAGEGIIYLGKLQADSNGNFSGNVTLSGGILVSSLTGITHYYYQNEWSTSEFGPNVEGASYSISGIVFEDVDNLGNPYNDTEDHLQPNVKVRLYQEDDAYTYLSGGDFYLDSTTTDASGAYTFSGLTNNDYYVVVDSRDIKVQSLNGGFSDSSVWAEQTFERRYIQDAYVDVKEFGGEDPAVSDFFDTSSTDVRDSVYQHISRAEVLGSNVSNIDFGFSFEVVVNENDSGNDGDQIDGNQGTLRQAILNSNAETGANNPRFVMMTPQNETSGGNLWWSVILQSSLPVVTDSDTALNGTVYATDSSVVNSNSSTFGSVTAGIDEHTISDFSGPEIEININDNDFGIRNDSSNFVLENFSLYNLGGNLGDAYSAVYLKGNYTLSDVISGLRADGSIPAEADKNSRFGFMFEGTGEIEHIYAAYSGTGILVQSDNATITEAVVTNNAAVAAGTDGNGIYFKDGKINLSNSYIYDNGGLNSAFDRGNGIYAKNITEGKILNSTVDLSNAAGVSLTSVQNLFISKTFAKSSVNGPGIRVDKNSKKGTFTQNSYGDNGGLAIDLIDDTTSLNEGVTPNDGVLDPNTANDGVDSPVFTLIELSDTDLTLAGYVGAGSGSSVFSGGIVEIYSAIYSEGDSYQDRDRGEGIKYLGELSIDSNGEFSGTLNLSAVDFEEISGLTIFDNDTSEFGINERIFGRLGISGYVYVDINFNKVKDYSEPGVSGVRIELWKYSEGVWYEVDFTNTDSSGYYSFEADKGEYRVVEDAGNVYDNPFEGADPSGYISSTPNSVLTQLIRLDKRVDFGDFSGFKVEGYVFEDKGDGSATSPHANNAVFDSDEKGISSVLVKITSGSNTYIRNTDSNGKYIFNIYNPPDFPITISEVDLTGYVSTGDYDSDGSDPIFERNRIVLNSVGNVDYNFADVKKINIKAVNSISAKPFSTAKLIHTLEVKTPGSVNISAITSNGYETKIYLLNSNGNILKPWDNSEILAVGVYDFLVEVYVPIDALPGTIDGVTITAVESWLNSNGTDTDDVVDLIYIGDEVVNLKKSLRNSTIGETFRLNNQALPGDELEYKIEFSNDGEEPIYEFGIIDAVDINTNLVNGIYPNSANVVLKLNSLFYYLIAEEGNDANFDGAYLIDNKLHVNIYFIAGNLYPGDKGEIFYTVKINE